ncbi:MAG: DinB family protein, partial [Candidatus Limnocylindrales bacterium]
MSDIERVPSMRKPARQGVPKRKPGDIAKPMLESGKTKDAPQITPRGMPGAPTPHLERPLPDEPMLPIEPTLPIEPERAPDPAPEPKPEPEPEREPEQVSEPEREPQAEPASDPQSWVASAESEFEPLLGHSEMPAVPPRLTLRQVVARVDDAFGQFRAAVARYPKEHMDERLGEDMWTRKQMLAHVAAWHDLTADRLVKMSLSGQPVALDRDVEKVNASAARVAVGKTAGEVLKDLEATFARMRRQLVRMTDVQLHSDDDWVIHIVAANTYEHYADHIADLA